MNIVSHAPLRQIIPPLLAATLLAGCVSAPPPTEVPSPTALPSPIPVVDRIGEIPETEVAANACDSGPDFTQVFTVSGDSSVSAGESFEKTWRIRNSGRCAWGEGIRLVFESGSALGSVDAVPIPDTPPGGEADISVAMVAPLAPGQYLSNWIIRDSAGRSHEPTLYAVVVVVQPAPPIPTATPPPPTPTSAPTDDRAPQPTRRPPAASDGSPPITIDTAQARQIFETGQQLGNYRNVFAKVGDSITASSSFLRPIGRGKYELGDYGDLQGVIDYFRKRSVKDGNSFTIDSVTAANGWASKEPLTVNRSSDPRCRQKTPLECEYDLIRPSVALIMLGTADSPTTIDSGSYEQNLSQVVQISMQRGVIPVLSTIPWRVDKDVRPFNEIVLRVSAAYDIPVMDYWQLMQQLPHHGSGADGVHPSLPPNNQTGDFTARGLGYGYNVRNWLALQMLDRLRQDVLTR